MIGVILLYPPFGLRVVLEYGPMPETLHSTWHVDISVDTCIVSPLCACLGLDKRSMPRFRRPNETPTHHKASATSSAEPSSCVTVAPVHPSRPPHGLGCPGSVAGGATIDLRKKTVEELHLDGAIARVGRRGFAGEGDVDGLAPG